MKHTNANAFRITFSELKFYKIIPECPQTTDLIKKYSVQKVDRKQDVKNIICGGFFRTTQESFDFKNLKNIIKISKNME